MARMIEEAIVIRLSKLVKDEDATQHIVSADAQLALEQVAQELAGPGVIVEVANT
jgi:hypothetical protein